MKKIILLALVAFVTISAKAYYYHFESNGIYYYIPDNSNNVAWVTSGEVKYSGTVTIPATVTNDGKTYIVTAIEGNGFEACEGLKEVILGENIDVIGGRAFKNCTNLTSVNWNDNIKELGGEAFQGCTSLTEVTLSANLRKSGGYNFRDCTNLKTIKFHDGVTVVGDGEFCGCTALKAVDIPNSVLTIGGNAFQRCSNLVSAKIGDGVQEISYHVFTDCSRLEKVILGAGITSIGMRTFGGDCKQLKSITILNPQVPSLVDDGFSSYDATIYVPSQSVDAYRNADIWKQFSAVKAYEDQVYLTVRQATQGAVKMLANVGERYSYDILPESGWVIHSVTFNNEDVTDQLVGNNYITPAMTSNGVLSIVFVEDGSGIRGARASDVRVSGDNNGNIIINEAPYGEVISVYSTNGTLLKQMTADGGRITIYMNTHGIYIVKVGDMTAKLSL